jgi:hypothetical protein
MMARASRVLEGVDSGADARQRGGYRGQGTGYRVRTGGGHGNPRLSAKSERYARGEARSTAEHAPTYSNCLTGMVFQCPGKQTICG